MKYTHLHCPSCNEETPYHPKIAGKRCDSCKAGSVLVPTVGSVADGAGSDGGNGRVVMYALIVLVIVQVNIFFGVSRMNVQQRLLEEFRERKLLARCPFCKRKLSFPATKANTWTTCFQCKTAFELPSIEEVEPIQ